MPRWAPINTPLERRKQTAVVAFCFFSMGMGVLLFLALLAWAPTRPLMLAYGAWILVDRAPFRGARRSAWWRSLPVWGYFRDYFPIRLVKTAALDPADGPFVMGFHPHGILGLSCFANLMTEAGGWAAKFPGVDVRVMGLTSVTMVPFARESLLALGVCSVAKESCEHALRLGPQSAIAIVVGGAKEALDAVPDKLELTLARRKGFVKLAIRQGAALVPILSFGENNAFNQFSRPWLRRAQVWLQERMGFSIPLFYGRGVLQYDYGFVPKRVPITTVVGAPIKAPQMDEPDQATIDRVHAQYVAGLQKLFEDHKEEYGGGLEEMVIK